MPQLIVITPVRNEAWVLEAFLTHCSSWADRIIVADQHSTDGSREIALRFPKVTLIDNDNTEMHQAAARSLLFREVDRIEGEKTVFALDADEFLSEGFGRTADWQRIVGSQAFEIFCFRWLNLYGDYRHALPDTGHMEWACHLPQGMSIAEEYERCESRAVHEMRIPCPEAGRARYVELEDIRFVHLAHLNRARQRNKSDFYQLHTLADLAGRRSGVGLYRAYHPHISSLRSLAGEARLVALHDTDLRPMVRVADHGQHYIDEMVAILRRESCRRFRTLCIWDNPDLRAAGIDYRPPFTVRLVHSYLRATQRQSHTLSVKAMDRLLSFFV